MSNISMKSKVYNFSTHPLNHTPFLNIGLNVNINAFIKICGYKNSRFFKKKKFFFLQSVLGYFILLLRHGTVSTSILASWGSSFRQFPAITKSGVIFASSHRSLSSKIIF